MEEMLTRRFRRWAAGQASTLQPGHKPDPSFSVLPDLVIVDGGKGQLGRVARVLDAVGPGQALPVVGLAKQREEIFFPGKSDPLMLPRHSPALYLLQRIRDEAHRYGITAHRKKRTALGLASQLDAFPGIGPGPPQGAPQALWIAGRHPRGLARGTEGRRAGKAARSIKAQLP